MRDERTLRLSSAGLTPALRDAYLTYQRELLEALATTGIGDWAGRFAFAHARALTAAQLDAHSHALAQRVVRAFCGQQVTARHLAARLAELEAVAAPTPKQQERLLSLRKELPRVSDTSELKALHGAEAVAVLEEKAEALVLLHEALAKAEGAGHLHPA
jgi:hypothetical protein